MNRFIAWLNHWWGVDRVNREVQILRKRAEQLNRERVASVQLIEERLEQLTKMRERFIKTIGSMEADLESANVLNKKLGAELQVVNEMLEAKDQLIIPGLTSACEMLHSRFEADVAVQAIRKMGAAVERGE